MDVQTLMEKLNFVAEVKRDQKICFKSKQMVPKHGLFQSCKRYWEEESSEDLQKNLNELILTSINYIIIRNFNYSHATVCVLLEKLMGAIERLAETYKDEEAMTSFFQLKNLEISVAISKLSPENRKMVSELKHTIKGNFLGQNKIHNKPISTITKDLEEEGE
jgi:hypothetical protein